MFIYDLASIYLPLNFLSLLDPGLFDPLITRAIILSLRDIAFTYMQHV